MPIIESFAKPPYSAPSHIFFIFFGIHFTVFRGFSKSSIFDIMALTVISPGMDVREGYEGLWKRNVSIDDF